MCAFGRLDYRARVPAAHSARHTPCCCVLTVQHPRAPQAKGEGKLFNLTVADASGEIRITGFNETYDQIYDNLTTGRVYTITGGTLKPKNAQYNLTSHGFEITLNRGCVVEECDEPQGAEQIPAHNYKFMGVADLANAADESKADVLAIVLSCTEPVTFTAKSGKCVLW